MIGCDLVDLSRIEKIYSRYEGKFLAKILSKKEEKLVKNSASLAGLFAAKEAASKALGCGICKDCGFLDIRIYKDKKNAPKLKFSKKIHKKFKFKKAYLSIAHDKGFAMAMVWLKK